MSFFLLKIYFGEGARGRENLSGLPTEHRGGEGLDLRTLRSVQESRLHGLSHPGAPQIHES